MLAPILVTDHDWFEYLQAHGPFDEVNFWRPSDQRRPSIAPGTPVLFKLRKPYGGWIVGYGLFARHDLVPAWLAWAAFGDKNGAPDFAGMRARIERLRRGSGRGRPTAPATVSARAGDYTIGCLMLSQPVFLDRGAWVQPPSDWPDNAVQGKGYDLSRGEGARVWQEVLAATAALRTGASLSGAPSAAADVPRYGDPTPVRPRLGQGTFRLAVTAAYDRACAVTQEHSLPALEAAHIRPFAEEGTHEVSNGLLLRSDIHRLFDMGYVGVTPEYRFVVSKSLKEDFENGRSYYPLNGKEIWVPGVLAERPDSRQLDWHLGVKFRG